MGTREVVEMGTRGAPLEKLVELLLDFDPAEVAPDECLRGWKTIAIAVGFSEDTLQRRFAELQIDLPRWGQPGRTTPVFLPKGKIVVLRRILMSAF